MKLPPLPWILLLLSVSGKNAAASDQTPFKIRSFLDNQIKQLKQSHTNSERMGNADNSGPRMSCELSLRLNRVDNFFSPAVTVPTIKESKILDALQGNEKPRLINLIKDLIIANECQEKCSSILRFIRHQEGTHSKARQQDIPMTEISTLCSLIQKDQTRISAQSINQLLQPYIKTTLKIAGGLSLSQTLFYYFEDNVIYWGAVAIVATLALLNHPFYTQAEKRRDDQQKLAEVHEKWHGNIPTLQ